MDTEIHQEIIQKIRIFWFIYARFHPYTWW